MSKQDRQGVRTPADLERKYDFGSLMNDQKSYSLLAGQINLLNQTLAQFMANTNVRFEEMETTETHFYSGIPTLENLPAINWTTDELKEEHIGDMYYDTDNGSTYLFKSTEDIYEWVKCSSGSVTITWVYSGNEVPTLENLPASEWITEQLKAAHVNNLYFDRLNSHMYIFQNVDNVYKWVDIFSNYYTKAEIDELLNPNP